MVQILEKIERGDGELRDLELLESINGRILGKVLCALGRVRRLPGLELHRALARRVRRPHPAGPLPVRGPSSIEGILAPSEQHHHARPRRKPLAVIRR
jgi:hypothetical protein